MYFIRYLEGLFCSWFDCLWLADGQTFHKPAEFLSCEVLDLTRITWPLETACI